jgi:hypothetical protein
MPLSEDFILTGRVPGESSEEPTDQLEQAKRTTAIADEVAPVIASLSPKLEALTHIDGDPIEAIQRAHFSGINRIEEIELTFTSDGQEKKRTFTKDEFDSL